MKLDYQDYKAELAKLLKEAFAIPSHTGKLPNPASIEAFDKVTDLVESHPSFWEERAYNDFFEEDI